VPVVMGNASGRRVQDGAGEYRYPPVAGLYFGDTMTLGGQEFPALSPESFLFDDINELNLLPAFPGEPLHGAAPQIQHTNTIRSLFSVRKDSLRLVQHNFANGDPGEDYHVEFLYDADVPCKITVLFLAEEICDRTGSIRYKPSNLRASMSYSRNVPAGSKQTFSFPELIRGIESQKDADIFFSLNSTVLPLVICMDTSVEQPTVRRLLEESVTLDELDEILIGCHAFVSIATFERRHQGCPFTARILVQKLVTGGAVYILREIYGIERRADDSPQPGDPSSPAVGETARADADDTENDDAKDCVVCMSELRDTMVLPCRHLCLCNPCAEVLRFQSNFCPICRAPFSSLLQIRAIRPSVVGENVPEDEAPDPRVPDGFRAVPIVDAIQSEPPQPMVAFSEYIDVSAADRDEADGSDGDVSLAEVDVNPLSSVRADDTGAPSVSSIAATGRVSSAEIESALPALLPDSAEPACLNPTGVAEPDATALAAEDAQRATLAS
jgi:hypothetical protein